MVVQAALPSSITTTDELEDILTTPPPELVADLDALHGDIMIVGSAGKMGPTLAVLAQRALDAAGAGRKVIAVSRFSDPAHKTRLEAAGVMTVSADLHDDKALTDLPNVPNIVYMLGTKFGTTGAEHQTWATNAFLAGKVAERFADSRFTVFSSGNVYPLLPVTQGGASERVAPDPVGEYAQSCLARERMFEHVSRTHGTPVSIFRLNYAIDLRYGVLHDIASQVRAGEPVNLAMGNANVIWQGDANAIALRALAKADSPPAIFNVTGPETISVRWLVSEFAQRFGVEPLVEGAEAPTALLSNASKAFGVFGYPRVPLAKMLDWIADWVAQGGPTLNKPTHFQARDGRF